MPNRPALGILSLLGLLVPGACLAAQFEARLDLSSSNRYTWHGLSRAAGIVAQSAVAAGFRSGRLTIATGFVRHHELDRVSPGELTELGTGSGRVGEDDFWAQAGLELGRFRLSSGVVRYHFRGEAPEGGGGPLRNTTEVSAAAGTIGRYLNPTLEAWWDVGRVRGAFLRASATSPVVGWPFEPFFFIALAGEVGLNLGQGPDPARPGDLANFSDRGVTHAALALNTVHRLHHWGGVGSASLSFGLNSQLNFDEAARFNGLGRRNGLILWLSAGVTLLLGGEARVLR